ncbi:MAG: carbohydrate ABC transporter permease [Treponemataceae bacterium]
MSFITSNNVNDIRKRETLSISIVFLMPAFFFLTVFVFYPIFDSFYLSLFEWNGIDPTKLFVGLQNWTTLLSDVRFWRSLMNNIVVLVLSIAIQLPIAMLIALLLDYAGRKWSFLRSIYFLPMLMSSVAIGFLFRYVYDPQFGLLNAFFQLFGQEKFIDLLGSSKYALFSVIAVICWQFIPFYIILFVASISSVSADIFEAAKIDGATYKKYALTIAVPCMKSTVKSSIILSMVGSLKYFDLIYVMTEGGPNGATELMATYMYKNTFLSLKLGYGATIAFAILVIISLLSLGTMKLINNDGDD